MDAFVNTWENLLNFSGRTSRKTFWTSYLIGLVFMGILCGILRTFHLSWIAGGASFLYSIAVFSLQVRRLHDIGKTGWLVLIKYIPVIGWLLLLYFYLQPSQGLNQYGTQPWN